MEFITSRTEIYRRTRAFLTLFASIAIGVFLASRLMGFPVSSNGYLVLGLIFLLLSAITFPFLYTVTRLKFLISDHEIRRINRLKSVDYPLPDISNIKIKRRRNGVIREIYIRFKNRPNLVITACENEFESIHAELVRRIDRNVTVEEIREPLDYDHLLFYPVLGLIISFAGIGVFKLIGNISYSSGRVIMFAVAGYLLTMAVYFILKKPLYSRTGGKHKTSDMIMGGAMVCACIAVLIAGVMY